MSTEGLENRWLLELINTLSSITGHKINLQKWIIFLYINNEQHESKINKQFHLQQH